LVAVSVLGQASVPALVLASAPILPVLRTSRVDAIVTHPREIGAANRIGHCAIYEDELQRIWPLEEENRRAKIEQFAKETDSS
jgi:hypothetical protein